MRIASVTAADYRADIDGLRALAIAAVVAYHYGLTRVSGGFTGVDIFFVISGFLITSHLKQEMASGSFSLLRFYDRRIRRIVPALLLMLALVLAAGWFLLIPGDYASAASSAVYAALGASNLYFMQHTGYFDRAADMQPLLHTWSLGVEEQFYVAWPLLLWAGMSLIRSTSALRVALLALVGGGFALAVYQLGHDPLSDFYLPFSRAWELAFGGLVAFVPGLQQRGIAVAAELAGLALCAVGFFWLKDSDPFPAQNAAYSCIGAALLLWPKREPLLARALSTAPLRWIGLISYSLYLWHWPTLVLFRTYANGHDPSPWQSCALVAVSVFLAWLSYRFVETPFRRLRPIQWRSVAAGLACCVLIALPAKWIASTQGAPWRASPELAKMRSLDTMWAWKCPRDVKVPGLAQSFCGFGTSWDQATTKAVLWGDSHAEHLAPLLDAAARGRPDSLILYDNCPAAFGGAINRVLPNTPAYQQYCTALYTHGVDFLKAHPEINLVILSSAWAPLVTGTTLVSDGTLAPGIGNDRLIISGLASLIDEVASPGRRFVIVADTPLIRESVVACATATVNGLLRQACPDTERHETRQFIERWQGGITDELKQLAASRTDTTVLTPWEAMCRSGVCENTLNGEFLYRDGSHLRRNLSDKTNLDLARLTGLAGILQ